MPFLNFSPLLGRSPKPTPNPNPTPIASKFTKFKYTSRSNDFTSSHSTYSTSTEVYTKEEAGSDYIK